HFTAAQLTNAKAIDYCRFLSCLYKTGGKEFAAAKMFGMLYPHAIHRDLVDQIITWAATPAGTTSDATWAGPLAPIQPLANGFLEFARPLSFLGRIPGLRRAPFNVSFAVQTTATSAGWVGEGKPKTLSAGGFTTVTMTAAKVAGTVTIT